MNVIVNDNALIVPDNSTLQALAEQIELPQEGVAIAINEEICPRNCWEQRALKANDQILIIRAYQGG